MRNFFFSTLGISENPGAPEPAITTLSALGDSNTEGFGLSNPESERYLTLLANELGKEQVNGGISGSCLSSGLNMYSPGISRYLDYIRANGIYIINIGINDIGHGGNVSQFTTDLNTVVDNLLNFYSHRRIILCSLAWVNEAVMLGNGMELTYTTTKHSEFNNALQNTATNQGVKFCDLYTAFINRNDLLQDGLHYNAAGHIHVKNSLLAVI